MGEFCSTLWRVEEGIDVTYVIIEKLIVDLVAGELMSLYDVNFHGCSSM